MKTRIQTAVFGGAHANAWKRSGNPESREEGAACRAVVFMKRIGVFVLMLSFPLVASPAMAALSVEDMVKFLEEQGLPGVSTAAVEGAIGGLIRSLDPEARICTAAEAEAIRVEWTGVEQAGVPPRAGAGSVDFFESWPEGLAYLKIKGLYPGGGREVMGHLRSLAEGSGVILDLRGTDGTDLDAVVDLASPFYCPGDPLFRVETLTGVTVEARKAVEGVEWRTPLMVLIDHDTRRAAETLVALWNGKPGVMLIGEPTRGDMSLRDLLPLPDGRFLYLATKRLIPAGGADESKGIRPDVMVEVKAGDRTPLVYVPGHGRPLSEKSVKDRDLMMRVDADPVLRRGTDILLALQALHDHGQR